MDWASQPHPFRYYEGTERILLPRDALVGTSVSIETVSQLLRFALGISAWKEYQGSRWALRVNPSSGNLHPTEAYVIGNFIGVKNRLYHYVSEDHSLEVRGELEPLMGQGNYCYIGFSSVIWREAWKYGERGFRYCQHDLGHALASISFSAQLLGWSVRPVPISHAKLSALLGTDRVDEFNSGEPEEAEVLLVVGRKLPSETSLVVQRWYGIPNTLSPSHDDWPHIEQMRLDSREGSKALETSTSAFAGTPKSREILLQRRSAVALDPIGGKLSKQKFFQILESTLYSQEAPWDSHPYEPCVHLLLFVHRVEGLSPGLYFLVRNPTDLNSLKQKSHAQFRWAQVPETALPLYLLLERDVREIAMRVSCNQDIAGDGFFSLGMVARFEAEISKYGPIAYRHLFWEAGIIGQILYLEAEAHGLRGTGIGCYFDDAVHELLGVPDRSFQSLYHFTVGIPVEDTRITTLPAYG